MHDDKEQLPPLAIKTKAVLFNSTFLTKVLKKFSYMVGVVNFRERHYIALQKSIAQTTNQNAILGPLLYMYWRLCTTVS